MLIHGWPLSARAWEPQLLALRAAGDPAGNLNFSRPASVALPKSRAETSTKPSKVGYQEVIELNVNTGGVRLYDGSWSTLVIAIHARPIA
jgi:pimeloyl-ACP methyl ester carboxylesterase